MTEDENKSRRANLNDLRESETKKKALDILQRAEKKIFSEADAQKIWYIMEKTIKDLKLLYEGFETANREVAILANVLAADVRSRAQEINMFLDLADQVLAGDRSFNWTAEELEELAGIDDKVAGKRAMRLVIDFLVSSARGELDMERTKSHLDLFERRLHRIYEVSLSYDKDVPRIKKIFYSRLIKMGKK